MTDKSTSDFIKANENMLALAVVEKLYLAYPQLESKYGLAGRKKCLQDSIYHLQYLAEAIGSASPVLFEDYIGWAETMLVSRHVPSDDLKKTLELMREVLQAHLPETGWPAAARCLDGALNNLPGISGGRGSYMPEESPLGELAGSYLKALLNGNRQAASQLVLEAVEQGVEVKDVYIDVFQSSQQELGRLWQTNQVSVAQEHYCTAATQMVMSQLYSHVFATPKNGRRMVGTSVGGNLHEIGMRMVTDFLELEGWDTYYLGANTPPESVVSAIENQKADLVGISATLASQVSQVQDLIERIRSSAWRPSIKIIVGGQPFNIASDLWKRIGADGYAPDAQAAVVVANRLFEDSH